MCHIKAQDLSNELSMLNCINFAKKVPMASVSITSKLRAAVIIKGGSYYSSAVIITGNTIVHNVIGIDYRLQFTY